MYNSFAKLIYFFVLSLFCFGNVDDVTDISADAMLYNGAASDDDGPIAVSEPVSAKVTLNNDATLCDDELSEAINALLAAELYPERLFFDGIDRLMFQWLRMMYNASRYYSFRFYEGYPKCSVKRLCDNNKEGKNMNAVFDMPHSNSMIWMILMALLGGILLNFMPCSIPALCFKTRSKDKVMYLAGVGFVFFLIASVFSLLRMAGHMLCWGMHMQNAWFLFGLYLVTLIFFIHALRGSSLYVSFSFKSKISSFIYGMICATLSLSCVAPFMGGACAFALSRGVCEIYLLMFCLFLGFISTYIGIFSRFSLFSKINVKCVESFFQASMLVLVLWFFSLLSSHLSIEQSVTIGMLSLLMLSLQSFSNKWLMMSVIAVAMLFVMHKRDVSVHSHGRGHHNVARSFGMSDRSRDMMPQDRAMRHRGAMPQTRPSRDEKLPECITFKAEISPRKLCDLMLQDRTMRRDATHQDRPDSDAKLPERFTFKAEISPCRSRDLMPQDRTISKGGMQQDRTDVVPSDKIQWYSFSKQSLNNAVGQNKIVLVYFTSDWCLTCQYLKKSVFESRDIIHRCMQSDIVCLQADLTKSNPEALAFLQKHNQYGIPCTMLFYKNGSYIMQEVYTASSLLSAIDMMSK